MDENSHILRITPLICPACGKRVEFCTSGRLICWDCGEIYYDDEKKVWKIRKFCNDYSSRDAKILKED